MIALGAARLMCRKVTSLCRWSRLARPARPAMLRAGTLGEPTLDETMGWTLFENGKTVGARGSENGAILVDEEHDLGARITLEQNAEIAPFAITCGIYGWAFHTRFFGTRAAADQDLEGMKNAIGLILLKIPDVDDPALDLKHHEVSQAISTFVDQFP